MYNYSENAKAQSNSAFQSAAWLTIIGTFTVPLALTAANNIFLSLSVILLLFTPQIKEYRCLLSANKTALIGTVLFIYLGLSISWANSEIAVSVKYLSKFREFLLIPMFMLIFAASKQRHAAFTSIYIAMLLSLVASYLIHFQIADLSENQHSLSNRIYHGISMSIFAYMSLQLAVRIPSYRWLFALIYCATLANLFFIENGRTGYLLIISLSALFFWQMFRWRGFAIVAIFIASALTITMWFYNLVELRIFAEDQSLLTGNSSLSLLNLQKADQRVEFYLLSTILFLQDWVIGTGLGDFGPEYLQLHSSMETYYGQTNNPHNEFLNIGVQTGIPGVILFSAFLLSLLIKRDKQAISQQRQFQAAIFITILISCLFNSSFMDHGDGTLFMILIALFCGSNWDTPLYKTTEELISQEQTDR
ncbi:O-antigen ligase family protein [Amphritea sp. HPY]|uniref:O-antigen ligase family protein n=1 Tax=Amphritea sp. HPY TaxID=3421652 RepID=UPI003D7E638B